ncbi:hypothetical protein [Ancylobacter lacus]|uniref:hypothetical protein n=1 Tax=Ancylobacter lacus TaxID=2579970 RepID=UPI001BCB28C7|nr:hypothetical protein [Ancylobacter lacus]MBS7538723.1 hypothetical protein [Ancylobacter lacus]
MPLLRLPVHPALRALAAVAALLAGFCQPTGPFGGADLHAAQAADTQSAAGTSTAKSGGKAAKNKAKAAAKVPAKPAGVWTFSRDDEAVVLQFRMPGAPAATLVATCRPGPGLFQLVAELSPPKAQVGDAVRLVVAAGRTKVEFAASVFPSVEAGRRAVEAQARLEPKLVQLFQEGEQLHLTAPGASATLPLGTAGRAVDSFTDACRTTRALPAKS